MSAVRATALARPSAPIRVLVVEDSLTQRAFLRRSLEADGDIVVVGEAGSAINAIAVAQQMKPDVVTMDLEIPGGGLSAIARIMESNPRPILLLSGRVGGPRTPEAVDALSAGAAGVLVKPLRWDEQSQRLLRGRIRTMRRIRMHHLEPARPDATGTPGTGKPGVEPPVERPVVGIGSSTGGPAALARVLRDLAGTPAPVLCVQHIHDHQVEGLARWLSGTTDADVRVAADGDTLANGVVLMAPGGTHLTLDRSRRVKLVPDAESLHTPSVDRMFASLAERCGSRVVACLLTGMGRDGADGMKAVHAAGGMTYVQDEASSVVYGMGRAAVEGDAVTRVLPLDSIGKTINRSVWRMS